MGERSRCCNYLRKYSRSLGLHGLIEIAKRLDNSLFSEVTAPPGIACHSSQRCEHAACASPEHQGFTAPNIFAADVKGLLFLRRLCHEAVK